MVYRKQYKKRRVAPRRRHYKNRKVSRVPRFGSGKIHSFKQIAELNNLNISTTTKETFFIYTFNLSQLPQAAVFNSLFDSYRINAVKITFYPFCNVNQGSATSFGLEIPNIYTAIDYDGTAQPTLVSVISEYQTCKYRYFNKPHIRYFKPKTVQNGALLTSGAYGNVVSYGKPWLDIAYPTVQYNSVIGAVVYTNGTQVIPPGQTVRVTAKFYFQCRDVK